VRQAIAHAIDRERIIRDIQRGYAQKTETMLADGHGHAPRTCLRPTTIPPSETALAQAGYPNGSSRLQDVDGCRGELARPGDAGDDETAGFNVSIQSNEMSTFFADIGKGNFQLYSLSRNGIADPDFYYVIFYSKNTPPNGQNRGYYANRTSTTC